MENEADLLRCYDQPNGVQRDPPHLLPSRQEKTYYSSKITRLAEEGWALRDPGVPEFCDRCHRRLREGPDGPYIAEMQVHKQVAKKVGYAGTTVHIEYLDNGERMECVHFPRQTGPPDELLHRIARQRYEEDRVKGRVKAVKSAKPKGNAAAKAKERQVQKDFKFKLGAGAMVNDNQYNAEKEYKFKVEAAAMANESQYRPKHGEALVTIWNLTQAGERKEQVVTLCQGAVDLSEEKWLTKYAGLEEIRNMHRWDFPMQTWVWLGGAVARPTQGHIFLRARQGECVDFGPCVAKICYLKVMTEEERKIEALAAIVLHGIYVTVLWNEHGMQVRLVRVWKPQVTAWKPQVTAWVTFFNVDKAMEGVHDATHGVHVVRNTATEPTPARMVLLADGEHPKPGFGVAMRNLHVAVEAARRTELNIERIKSEQYESSDDDANRMHTNIIALTHSKAHKCYFVNEIKLIIY
ncbi:uncharacterized protein BXZ73DRAFT_107684 [Epithele typhae]|uniref:uncharacterized protein n=1 Tax=Epithele typhae TaxID=378194 RepID=UPI00200842BD|nr:uncharacterized protein BXZ73DRAFT_107684 [Epithele typhae]KAH9912051.1 hypothetical protein BXZ73DRAFT_107684 [Epithele typhae]